MKNVCVLALSVVIGFFPIASSSANELDYQGKVLVNDLPFTGGGLFKFAISDSANTTNYWSNDGTGAGEPVGSITNPVWNGLFSVILGSPPMISIAPSTFSTTNSRYLRVWFNGGSGFSEMLPAQKIVASATAINANLLGGQTSGELQAAAVTQATNAITMAGAILGPPHANSIAPGIIVNADINAGAGIEGTKVLAGTTLVRGTLRLSAGATTNIAVGEGDPQLNGFSKVNSIVAGSPNSSFGIVGAGGISVVDSGTDVVISALPLSNLDNTIWVALNGSPVGPGTIDSPYDSPQAGYDAAATKFPGTPSTLLIAAGDYASAGHSLTMASGTVHVVGLHRPRLKSLDVMGFAHPSLSGYQNVEGLVLDGTVAVRSSGGLVRFYNCRMNDSAVVVGSSVIFQNCRIGAPDGAAALSLATMPLSSASGVGVYQSSIESRAPGFGAIEIGYPGMPLPTMQNLEVIGCEIVNLLGPAIQDHSPFHGAAFPKKLFTHNYIKGPLPGAGVPAVADPGVVFPYPPGTGPFLVFYHNAIQGDVGSAPGGIAHTQFYGLNMVNGTINYPGVGVVGWLQAGAGVAGPDPSGNVEHNIVFPGPLPDSWND